MVAKRGAPMLVPSNQSDGFLRRSRLTRVVPATVGGRPGVALFQGDQLRLVLTAEDATEVCDLIFDLLDEVE